MRFIGSFFAMIIENKMKIFLCIVLYVVFLFTLFPFGDLGSFVTTQVAQLTRNQIFVKFETLDLSILPAPGFEATNVKVQGAMFPMVTADYMNVSPSLTGLITLNPGVSVRTEGLMEGNVNVRTKTAGSTEAGMKRQNIVLDAEDVSLTKLAEALSLSMNLEGKMNLQADTTLDPSFIEQPNGAVEMNIKDLNLTGASLMTPIGPLNLPDTKLKTIELKGNMNKGEFAFEKAVLGVPQDEVFAQVKGTMNLNFQTQARGDVNVVPGAFDLTVQIKAKPQFISKAGLFLSFIDQYKKKESASEGNEYLFRITGQNFFAPPRISPVATF